MRIAAFDLGSNSTRMLIAEAHRGVAIPLAWRTRITRLGEGFAGGSLLPEAIDRTIDTLAEFAAEARRERVCHVRAVATSAVRDAANAEDLLVRAAMLNLPVEVLSGDREASLTHLGASAGLDAGTRCLVIDVGGGSTELVLGFHGQVESHASVNLGCVRSSEQYPLSDPPLREQVDALVRIVIESVRPAAGRFAAVSALPAIAVAGTVTSLAAVKQKLVPYDPERVHGFSMTLGDVSGLLDGLSAMTVEERKGLPGMEAERADTIVTGTAILLGIMKLLGLSSVTVSEHGVLYGLALELAGHATGARG